MPISIDFQNRITELVAESEYKKSELPIIMNVDYRSLSNALNYGIIPKPRILIRIANYFNVSIKFLLGKTETDDFVAAQSPTDFNSRFIALVEVCLFLSNSKIV